MPEYEDPIYIKMNKKAPEIQELWKPTAGDWFYKEDGIGYGSWLVCKIEHGSLWCSGERMDKPPFDGKLVQFMVPENYIWLPRQDQLQEMVNYKERTSYPVSHLLSDLNDFYISGHINWFGKDDDHSSITWEQLWLAFVMNKKYNKIWNGKDWVTEVLR